MVFNKSSNRPSNVESSGSPEVVKSTATKVENLPNMGVAEAVSGIEGAESVENIDGRVSETSGKGKDRKGDGVTAGSTGGAVDPDEIRKMILSKMPAEIVMRNQVKQEIQKEIKYLHRRAMKMIVSPSSVSFFELANLMKKIRELKGLLMTLARASFDAVKTMWLRFVHGVM